MQSWRLVHSSIDRSHAGRGVVSLEPTQHRDKSRGAAAMPLLSFRPRSSGLQVIAQMCPRWHRQGARAGHQELEGHRFSARRQDQRHTGSARGRERHSQGGQARRPATATRRFTGSHGKCGTRHSPATPRAVFAFLATAGRAYHSPVNLVCLPSTRGERGGAVHSPSPCRRR